MKFRTVQKLVWIDTVFLELPVPCLDKYCTLKVVFRMYNRASLGMRL